jgi:hypothetical protein
VSSQCIRRGPTGPVAVAMAACSMGVCLSGMRPAACQAAAACGRSHGCVSSFPAAAGQLASSPGGRASSVAAHAHPAHPSGLTSRLACTGQARGEVLGQAGLQQRPGAALGTCRWRNIRAAGRSKVSSKKWRGHSAAAFSAGANRAQQGALGLGSAWMQTAGIQAGRSCAMVRKGQRWGRAL